MDIFITQTTTIELVNSVFPKCPYKYTIQNVESLQISPGSSHKRICKFKVELTHNIWIKCLKYYIEYFVEVTRGNGLNINCISYHENNIDNFAHMINILFENYRFAFHIKTAHALNRQVPFISVLLFYQQAWKQRSWYIRRTRLQN